VQFSTFEPVKYTQQVVAGMIYKVVFKVDGDKFIHTKVFAPLPHTGAAPECQEFQDNKGIEDEFTS